MDRLWLQKVKFERTLWPMLVLTSSLLAAQQGIISPVDQRRIHHPTVRRNTCSVWMWAESQRGVDETDLKEFMSRVVLSWHSGGTSGQSFCEPATLSEYIFRLCCLKISECINIPLSNEAEIDRPRETKLRTGLEKINHCYITSAALSVEHRLWKRAGIKGPVWAGCTESAYCRETASCKEAVSLMDLM